MDISTRIEIVPVTKLISEINTKSLLSLDDIKSDIKPEINTKESNEQISAARSFIQYLAMEIYDKEVLSKFEGQIVVDLGCADNGYGYEVARIGKAKAYIGVEGWIPKDFLLSLEEGISKEMFLQEFRDYHPIPASVIAEDMISALKRFPENSISIFAANINWTLFFPDENYLNRLSEQVYRVLSPSGALVSYMSDVHHQQLKSELFDNNHQLYRYTK